MDLVERFAVHEPTLGYFCTWAAQCAAGAMQMPQRADGRPDVERYTFLDLTQASRDSLSEQFIFHSPGLAVEAHEVVREQLYFVLDDGWDAPAGLRQDRDPSRIGSLRLSVDRFPSFPGNPVEQLDTLNEVLQRLDWRGLGIGVGAAANGEGQGGNAMSLEEQETYWRTRLQWSAAAGVEYWKVNLGLHTDELALRERLTQWAREIAPDLIIEHAPGEGPGTFNDIRIDEQSGLVTGSGRFEGQTVERWLDLLAFSDVFRSYDVRGELAIPTTLDRVATLLARAGSDGAGRGVLNCGDEAYLGAALGCSVGVMRSPPWSRAGQSTSRQMEVIRALRWQRIMPPWSVKSGGVSLGEQVLWDEHTIDETDVWWGRQAGKTLRQGAPAVVARGLPLPGVEVAGDRPFVVASRHANGAVAVGILPRSVEGTGERRTPAAEVSIELPAGSGPIGVFGSPHRLTLRGEAVAGAVKVYGQDLACDKAYDLTSRVSLGEGSLTVGQSLIRELCAAGVADGSEPGFVLSLEPGDGG